jgi:hypothetical protein
MSLVITNWLLTSTLTRCSSFHENDTESQRIVIENLSKYLLRKSNLTNILIGRVNNNQVETIEFFLCLR